MSNRGRPMQRVLKRIALHGLLTALLLGVVGAMLAEMASMWLSSAAGPRVAQVEGGAAPLSALPDTVRTRLPLTLAVWGFAFVAIGELLIYAVRGEKPAAPKAVAPPGPDPAVQLLEELLSQADIALEKEKAQQKEQQKATAPKPPPEDTQHAASILTPDS